MQVGIKPGTTYTIKPLVFVDAGDGDYVAIPDSKWFYRVYKRPRNKWGVLIYGWRLERTLKPCDSLAHGKQLCQQHWESEAGIGKYLEAVR